MSQNKTKVQGLELDNAQSFSLLQQNPGANGFYSRNSAVSSPGTVVSGVTDNVSPVSMLSSKNTMATTGKPVVGFLYSVSRTLVGEYWPLHIGSNTIGNDPNCDIVLGEGTVSRIHATLQVRRAKNTGHISAWVSDPGSTNGTLINDVCLCSAPLDCKNGDIITIGDNYQLYVVLIDVSALNLKVNENFVPVNIPNVPTPFEQTPAMDETDGDTASPTFNPWGGSEYIPTPGTIGIDGSSSPNHGGTKPL